jgi:uncharacterized protein YbaP (TraB family)
MRHYLVCFLLGFSLLILFSSSGAYAAPVFKVSKDGDTVYIGGTFHLLTEGDYPLPKAFEKAYVASDELYFETDLSVLETTEFQQKSLHVIMYKDGKTLKTGLNEKTYARFAEYAESRHLDPMQFNSLNPTGIMLTITIMEYQSRGFVAEGVDKYYYEKARKDTKAIGWFETPDEQLAIIDGFDNEEPNALINYTLDEIDNVDEVVGGLHTSWRSGDMDTLAKLGLDGFDGYAQLYDLVLRNRNNNWMKKIEAMFGDQNIEFVLVGALHLPGKDGVLTQLAQKGYTVEQLAN